MMIVARLDDGTEVLVVVRSPASKLGESTHQGGPGHASHVDRSAVVDAHGEEVPQSERAA